MVQQRMSNTFSRKTDNGYRLIEHLKYFLEFTEIVYFQFRVAWILFHSVKLLLLPTTTLLTGQPILKSLESLL